MPSETSRAGAWQRVAALLLRVLIAAVFAVSALAKLWSIDLFELYIYSYALLPLNVCFVVARMCIGLELVLAMLTAIGWWRRLTNMTTLLLLLLFSLFLCYTLLVGRTDSCQCFGTLVDMRPEVSLLKNATLIAAVLAYMRVCGEDRRGWHRVAVPIVAVAMMVVPFAVSVPDNWMFGAEETRFGRVKFEQSLQEECELGKLGLTQGRYMVGFMTPGCPYCRMARQKIDGIAKRNRLPRERIVFLEPEDVGTKYFMEVTKGQRPLLLLVEDGVVQTTYHYRNISERQMSGFLRGE